MRELISNGAEPPRLAQRPEGHNDWVAEFTLDLAASRASGEPALSLVRLGALI